jgi:hypothetical protein
MEHIQAGLVRIRYNTESDGRVLVWRMVIDGKERLVNNIKVEKPCFTSSDWMEELGCYKHHISIQDCTISIHPDTQEATITEQ